MLFSQTSNPPNIVDDHPLGVFYDTFIEHRGTNGVVDSIDALFYVKNIGGRGEINVTVTLRNYNEYKQFTVDSNARYELISSFPAHNFTSALPNINLNISASFSGTSGITLTNTLYVTGYNAWGVTDTTRSKLLSLGSITSVENNQSSILKKFYLQQNYPNPFNPSTDISFNLPSKSFVSLKVFDLIGRDVATIVSEELSAGNHTKQWNAENYPSGVYFYRLQAGTFTETKKLVLLR